MRSGTDVRRSSWEVGALVAVIGLLLAACGLAPGTNRRSALSADDVGPRILEISTRLPARTDEQRPLNRRAASGAAQDAEGAPSAALRIDAAIDAERLARAGRVTPAAPPASPAMPALPSITMAFSGDTLIHSPLVRQAERNTSGAGYDFTPMFADIAHIISGVDLAICHLETPIAPMGEPLSTYPLYGVPAEVIGGLASAGYDRCSTASNHSLDRGIAGIDATVDALEADGLGQSGMARTPAESVPAIIDVGGIAIAHLSYAFGFNGIQLPQATPWRTNLIDPQRIIADAQGARARGASAVIVSLHWGAEGSWQVTPVQRSIAETITASGAVDLIVGHHSHVIQPIEMVNGRWVVFGMGDFLSNMPVASQWTASTQDGVIVTIGMHRLADGTVQVDRPVALPTWVDKDRGFIIRPVLEQVSDPNVPAGLRGQLYQSLSRTNGVIGAFVPGQ